MVPRAALGVIPVLAVLLWCRDSLDVRTLPELVGAGLAMLLVFALTWVFFVYRPDPYMDLRARLGAPQTEEQA